MVYFVLLDGVRDLNEEGVNFQGGGMAPCLGMLGADAPAWDFQQRPSTKLRQTGLELYFLADHKGLGEKTWQQ